MKENLLTRTQRHAFERKLRGRAGSPRRKRLAFECVIGDLDETEFKSTFGDGRDSFSASWTLLGSRLRRDTRGGNTSSGVVSPCALLGLTFRMLAKGSYLDMKLIFGVHRFGAYFVFRDAVHGICTVL